jgi:hypothetical protein
VPANGLFLLFGNCIWVLGALFLEQEVPFLKA